MTKLGRVAWQYAEKALCHLFKQILGRLRQLTHIAGVTAQTRIVQDGAHVQPVKTDRLEQSHCSDGRAIPALIARRQHHPLCTAHIVPRHWCALPAIRSADNLAQCGGVLDPRCHPTIRGAAAALR